MLNGGGIRWSKPFLNFFLKVNECNFLKITQRYFSTYFLKEALDITKTGVWFFYVSSNEKDAEC
jgi:hypothetical protein